MGKVSDSYITTGDYMEALGTPSVGSIGGEWMVIGLARSDRNVPGVEDYYKKVQEYVAENIDPETGRLHKAKSTDNSRIIIALTAIGRDVTNVGGYDLLQGLSDLEFVKYQGNNGPIWALLALDSGNYPVPTGGTVTRQALIDEILRVQTSDGGWTVSGDKADSDMTGMALTALAGPVSNLLLAVAAMLISKVIYLYAPYSAAMDVVFSFCLYTLAPLSIGLGLFNLIPIPPLDGSKVLAAFLPDRQYIALMRYERYGILVLLVLSFAGIGSSLISRGILGVYSALLTLFFG